jgi:hypothetical protein
MPDQLSKAERFYIASNRETPIKTLAKELGLKPKQVKEYLAELEEEAKKANPSNPPLLPANKHGSVVMTEGASKIGDDMLAANPGPVISPKIKNCVWVAPKEKKPNV